ncbi:hypothetical protein ACROYT_G012504 [Oculina patagonica]
MKTNKGLSVRFKMVWFYYLLLAVVAAEAGKRQLVMKGLFPKGQNHDLKQDNQIRISGTGMIRKNGQTSLNIQVEIGPAAGAGGPGAGKGRPGPGAGGPAPGAGGPTPAPGGPTPGAGGPTPAPGGPTPSPGGPTPAPGGPTPTAGGPTPTAGGPTPTAGGPTPGAGGPTPGAGGPTPTAGGPTPTAGVPTPGAGGEFTKEEQIGLATHNEFRQVHGVPMMTLDRQMCDQAKAYAQKIAKMGGLKHSSRQEREGQGENLSMGCSTNQAQAMEEAVTNWYNEVCDPGYNFATGGFSGGTGHFTQVVWKGSTVLGVGRAEVEQNGMKCAYIVGRYKPAGNMMGDFPKNVPKGKFDASSYCSTVKNKRRKFYDKQGQAVIIGSPMSAVDVPSAKTGPSEFRRQQNELFNSKKKKTSITNKLN